MAAPIEIGALQEAEAADLARALAARGLVATPTRHRGTIWLAVCESREETERLLADVSAAVSDWLAERQRSPLELRIGTRVETVAPHGDLRDALRARAAKTARSSRRRG